MLHSVAKVPPIDQCFVAQCSESTTNRSVFCCTVQRKHHKPVSVLLHSVAKVLPIGHIFAAQYSESTKKRSVFCCIVQRKYYQSVSVAAVAKVTQTGQCFVVGSRQCDWQFKRCDITFRICDIPLAGLIEFSSCQHCISLKKKN